MSMLEKALPFVATWGVGFLAALLAVAMFVLWRLGRGGRFLIPARWPGRLASAAALAVAALAALGLFGLLGPLQPMLAQVRAIHGTIGHPAGDLDFQLVADQSPRSLKALRGKVVLVNLWATWCQPCRRELPGVDRLQRDYADRGLVVVTLSNEDRELLMRFAAKYPYSTVNAYATRLGWLDVPGRPVSIVVDRDGVVRECLIGARTYDELREKVTRYLGPSS